MTNPSHVVKGSADAVERGKRGHARMRELADAMRHEIAVNADAMIRGLNRPATELEILQAEAITSLFLKARRLRDQGKNDLEVLREATIMTSSSAFRSPHDYSPRATEKESR
jgi:hypothetical protein